MSDQKNSQEQYTPRLVHRLVVREFGFITYYITGNKHIGGGITGPIWEDVMAGEYHVMGGDAHNEGQIISVIPKSIEPVVDYCSTKEAQNVNP